VAATDVLPDDDLADAVAAVLGYPGRQKLYDSNARWAATVGRANQTAYDQLRTAALSAGYSLTQFLDWDLGADFQRDLGTYWALAKGIGLTSLEPSVLKPLNRLAEAQAALEAGMLIGGVLQQPGQSAGSDAPAAPAGPLDFSCGYFGNPFRRHCPPAPAAPAADAGWDWGDGSPMKWPDGDRVG
jgi:hypothetical protein